MKFRTLCLFLGLLATNSVTAQQIHLFFLADRASTFGQKDRTEMENFWRYVGPYLDYKLVVHTAYSRDELLKTLRQTPIGAKKDIAIFYFSGRGETASDRVWPIMKLRSTSEEIPMRDVLEVLRPRKAMQTVVIADCDNLPEPEYVARVVPRPHPPAMRESSQLLFFGELECKHKMVIKIASASAGQAARRDPNGNSLFLSALLVALKEQMAQADPRWGLNRTTNTVKSSIIATLNRLTNGRQKPRIVMDCPADVGDDEIPTDTTTTNKE